MKKINVGLLGCGAIAKEHARVFMNLGNARIAAWWDRFPERAQAFHAEFGGQYWAEDFQRIVADPDIDALYLCTMHNDRLRFLQAAAAAGKPVFCEKPLAHTPQALREIQKLVREDGLVIHAGYKIRYHSIMAAARRALPAPEILHAQVFDTTWPEGPLNDPAVAGGNVLCQGVYAAEAIRALVQSEPLSVAATTRCQRHAGGAIDSLAASFTFANGAIATIAVADAGVAPDPVSKFFVTAAGGNRAIAIMNRFQTLVGCEGEDMLSFPEDGFLRQTEGFLASIINGRAPEISFRDGATPSIMMWRALEAAGCGRTVALNVDEFINGCCV